MSSSQSFDTPLKRIESYQYPHTHDGHLSESQSTALESFRALCEKEGYYTPATPNRGPSHDNETLLRYLRARKFIPKEAFQQFKDTEDWRKDNKIDDLYENIDVHDYDETRKLYPQWTGRRDKRGIPVYVFEVAPLNSKRMAAYEKSIAKTKSTGKTSPKLLRLFALYENLLRFTMPLCSGVPNRPYAETPVSQSNNIVDIAGVGLKQFWNLKQHMQDASQLATAHYPETLDRIFVIGAPSFFPTVWSWIKGWFDPITVSKIFILSKSNMQSTLTQYIDPSNIPRKYGGTLEWECGDLPSLDPAITGVLQWENPSKGPNGQNGFPFGPIKWRSSSEGDMVAHAVGSVNGKPRNDTIARLPVHDPSLNLGPTMSIETPMPGSGARSPYAYGAPSTTGEHTHPSDSQEYFPSTGVTPPEEHDEASLRASLMSPQNDTQIPVATTPTQASSQTAASQDTRTGTSATRYAEQDRTLAAGQLAEGTPLTVDNGYGDKTSIVEPATVGQAPKNVEVPEAQPATEGQTESKGYVQLAKEAAGSVYTTAATVVTGAGDTVLNAVGMGGEKDVGEGAQTDGSLAGATQSLSLESGTAEQQDTTAGEAKAADQSVDAMENKDVEDFIRTQYAHHGKSGNGTKT